MDFLTPSTLAAQACNYSGKSPKKLSSSRGLNLIELMIIAVIVCVIALLSVPSFFAMVQRYRLVSMAQNIYYNLQYARSEALKRGNTVYVSFNTGSNWCYGINSGSSCNCSTPSSCNLGTYTPPSSLTTLSLSGFGTLTFEGTRGSASAAGTITLTATGGTQSMGVDVGTLGNLTICSNNISGYSPC